MTFRETLRGQFSWKALFSWDTLLFFIIYAVIRWVLGGYPAWASVSIAVIVDLARKIAWDAFEFWRASR